jgi:hypothetical protein
MMKAPESSAAPATSQMQVKWSRFDEEGEQSLHGQRAAEDGTDVAGVGRPVHAELELLDQSGHDPDGHVDEQQRPEESGQSPVDVLPVAVPGGLKKRNQEREADGDGDEEEVIDAGGRELPPSKVRVHASIVPSLATPGSSTDPGTVVLRSASMPSLSVRISSHQSSQ